MFFNDYIHVRCFYEQSEEWWIFIVPANYGVGIGEGGVESGDGWIQGFEIGHSESITSKKISEDDDEIYKVKKRHDKSSNSCKISRNYSIKFMQLTKSSNSHRIKL